MRWRTGRRSSNVEDRRSVRLGRRAAGGGIGTVVIALLAAYFFGVNPSTILQSGGQLGSMGLGTGSPAPRSSQENTQADFVSVVLADTEDTWHALFRQMGRHYKEPKLVLFSGAVRSACGRAEAAMGPFYCPGDEKVYIDLSFYRDLKQRHHAPGDFAQAYVIAHEVGHHVQNLLGISRKVQAARRQVSKEEGNRLSVRLELQADCFAGIWANHAQRARSIIEKGDIEEALNAASAIGDDRLQREARGYVVPESFTHGSSRQRIEWFSRGIESGKLSSCNTFAAAKL